MDSITLLTWVMGAGFAVMTAGFSLTWMMMFWSLKRMDKIQETVTDIDRRLCRLEGAFSKDFCMLKHEHKEKVS